tara:strand:- start:87 stop:365 length:279 start_codon:yes stop_codon:yes gene_type:complete
MMDTLCILFMTGYFSYSDGTFGPVPEDTNRIEVRTEKFRTLLFKINDEKWFGNVNGKIFYNTLPRYRDHICELAEKQPLPKEAYKQRAILVE